MKKNQLFSMEKLDHNFHNNFPEFLSSVASIKKELDKKLTVNLIGQSPNKQGKHPNETLACFTKKEAFDEWLGKTYRYSIR